MTVYDIASSSKFATNFYLELGRFTEDFVPFVIYVSGNPNFIDIYKREAKSPRCCPLD